MARYKLNHSYRSFRDGVQYGPWTAGDEVELTDADAEWLERDSPGVLVKPEPEPDPEPEKSAERQKPPAADRQHRGGRNRSA